MNVRELVENMERDLKKEMDEVGSLDRLLIEKSIIERMKRAVEKYDRDHQWDDVSNG